MILNQFKSQNLGSKKKIGKKEERNGGREGEREREKENIKEEGRKKERKEKKEERGYVMFQVTGGIQENTTDFLQLEPEEKIGFF